MKSVQLTQGKVALVDDEDLEHVSRCKWYANQNQSSGIWYAARHGKKPERLTILMHNEIIGGLFVDHINRDGLDNRRNNLRFATKSQNGGNVKIRCDNTSGVKGVSWYSPYRRWRCRISGFHIGYFDDKNAAIMARREAEKQYFGEYAK